MTREATGRPIGACGRGEHARCVDADETCPCTCHGRDRGLIRRSFSASGSGTPPLVADRPTPRERAEAARKRLRDALEPHSDAERLTVEWLCGWDLDVTENLANMLDRVRDGAK